MSFRQRVLHSAPLIAFTLVIVFLGLSLAGYDSADPPGWNASPRNEPADQSLRPGRSDAGPCSVHHARLVVLALAAGTRGPRSLGVRQAARSRSTGTVLSASAWC